MATHTSPADWWNEDEATLLTVAHILDQVAKASSGKASKARREGGDGGRA